MAIFFANLHISTVHTPKSNLSVVKLWPRQLDKNFELQPTSKSTSKKKVIASSDRPRPSNLLILQKVHEIFMFRARFENT